MEENERNQWNWGEAVFFLAGVVCIELLFMILHKPIFDQVEIIDNVSKHIFNLKFVLLTRVIDFAFIIFFCVIVRKKGITSIGFSFDNIKGQVKFAVRMALFFGLAVLFADFLYYLFFHGDLVRQLLVPAKAPLLHRPKYLIAYIATGVIWAPLIEEIVFRGVLYKLIRKKLKFFPAALISSIIFAGAHGLLGNPPVIQFIGGILFAYIFEKSGSIISSFLFHSLGNMAIITVVFLYTL